MYLVGDEACGIDPHAMQHDGKLAGEGPTSAFFIPARLASFIARLFRPPPLIGRVRMMWAAS